jgi:predicted HicB family RNase H-like nuclease
VKRIVKGLAYDTDASTLIAKSEYPDANNADHFVYGSLYRTRGGAFFEHQFVVSKNGDGEEVSTNHFVPMSLSEAQRWVTEGDVELIDEDFLDVPEATAEAAAVEATATIYLRAPVALKRRIDEAAVAKGVSVNAYMLGIAEASLEPSMVWPSRKK